ncbi:MAG TPA: hypothetical protein VFF52_06550 [Isosphaeraceae bacterium]|nr:hypothetical protein [Isosphaeraceae bacterium]
MKRQGRFQRFEDGVDQRGELAADALEPAAAQAGLAGRVAALFPREPPLAAPARAGLSGLLTVVGRVGFAARRGLAVNRVRGRSVRLAMVASLGAI